MPKPKTPAQKAKLAEYMRKYRANANNSKRERKLERERYHERHPDSYPLPPTANLVRSNNHPVRHRVLPFSTKIRIPAPIPYVSKSIADRKEYEAKRKARYRLIKRQENEALFLKKQREEKQRQRRI